MATRISAGVIVQVSSISVPCVWYLCTIACRSELKLIRIDPITQNTRNEIRTR